MADSTRAMRSAIFERELSPVCKNRLLHEITQTISERSARKSLIVGRARDPCAGYLEADLRLCDFAWRKGR